MSPQTNKKSQAEKKEDTFDFIADNSSKDNFIHWLLNNTQTTVSKDDDWSRIKSEVLTDENVSYAKLRDYAITLKPEKETEATLETVKKETEEAEEIARKLTFLGKLKKFSIAVGGIILFLGIAHLATVVLMISSPEFFDLTSNPTINSTLAVFLGLSGLTEILGGLLLIAK